MKILISDYDGTFSGNGINREENVKAVKKFREQGNKFLICTGRGPYRIKNVIDFDVDGFITSGGALIQVEDVVEARIISNDIIKELNEYLLSLNPIVFTNNTIDNKCYLTNDKEMYARGLKLYGNTYPEPLEKDVISISVMFDTEEKANEMKQLIDKKFNNKLAVLTNINYLDISAPGITKEYGCSRIKENYPDAYITTIGDNVNDLNMLLMFNGVCVKNGNKVVKKKCNKVVDSVADYIYELLDNNK